MLRRNFARLVLVPAVGLSGCVLRRDSGTGYLSIINRSDDVRRLTVHVEHDGETVFESIFNVPSLSGEHEIFLKDIFHGRNGDEFFVECELEGAGQLHEYTFQFECAEAESAFDMDPKDGLFIEILEGDEIEFKQNRCS
ncbi:hypothetical protein [Halovivax gelatinilyticus]|uniref:hypothetical protein n=1 Tax=Halovivax gelatinilyticus TaxID=2961597 RepID=UPI0020CA6E85|nr:hypothetical protein [Halovivax gelatinilyticus]